MWHNEGGTTVVVGTTRLSLVRVGFKGRKAYCLMETSTDQHYSWSQGGSEGCSSLRHMS